MGSEAKNWRDEFTSEVLSALRLAIPEGLNAAQARSSRAQTEYRDPKGHQYIYGTGMARGAQDECQQRLQALTAYAERPVPRSSRVTMHLGDNLIHIQRVGKKMPNNHLRVRLNYLSEARRDQLTEASSDMYATMPPMPLFQLPEDDAFASLEEADAASRSLKSGSLFVAYFSSTPFALGQMYLAPAQLRGNYLEFADPEPLVFRRTGSTQKKQNDTATTVKRFASGDRPRTTAKLRDE